MWAKLPESGDLPGQGRSHPPTVVAPSSRTATCASASACGSRPSWACCSSTASTPGCRRSWARPATRSRPAPALLLLLNLGAVIGLIVAGTIADSRGNKPTVLVWFGLAAVFLALLSIKMQSELLVYGAVLLTGIFVFSAQVLVYAFVGHLYPPEIRGTALGLSAGIGRVGAIVGPSITGALVTAGIAYPWGFYVFAGAALLAVLALATVPAHMRVRRPPTPAQGDPLGRDDRPHRGPGAPAEVGEARRSRAASGGSPRPHVVARVGERLRRTARPRRAAGPARRPRRPPAAGRRGRGRAAARAASRVGSASWSRSGRGRPPCRRC